MRRTTRRSGRIWQSLIQSWWMGVVLFVTFGLYSEGMRQKGAVEKRMRGEIFTLNQEIASFRKEKELLSLELTSHSDPEWVELVLMRNLGVVPEGQTKVYFK